MIVPSVEQVLCATNTLVICVHFNRLKGPGQGNIERGDTKEIVKPLFDMLADR